MINYYDDSVLAQVAKSGNMYTPPGKAYCGVKAGKSRKKNGRVGISATEIRLARLFLALQI